MKYYKVIDPDEHNNHIEETLSEQDVLDHYWEYWYEAMVRADKRDLISLDRCIEDWVVVNWAVEVDPDKELYKIMSEVYNHLLNNSQPIDLGITTGELWDLYEE